MELRDYQKDIINKIIQYLNINNRCCVSLATGGGKTVIFSELLKHLKGKTLVCVHREELVYQTSKTILLEHDLLLPKNKNISKDIVIAMVQTLHNRLKKEQINLNDFDNIIIDEAHRGEFIKILNNYKGKVIGFTATPNYEKNRYFYKCLECGNEQDISGECCKRKLKKYKELIPLSKYYNHLIEGIDINGLIENGYLVKEDNYTLEVDTSFLVYDPLINDYTEESIALVFGSDEAIENTVNVYQKLALDKKTIIFNPNTLVNKKLYQSMLNKGINVKMYDSKNENECRKDLVDWFKNTPNAVLLNVQVFTTGFDCTDVEVIFLNKKTQSINLFIQMVGRGGRITDKIFKPNFKVIDMGNNIKDLGSWSDKRNWSDYFYKKELKEVGSSSIASVRTCHNCESIIAANSLICPICNTERIYKKGGVIGLPERNGKPIIPSPNEIIDYCEKHNLETLEARKIVYNYIAEMFYKTSYESYIKNKNNGNLFEKTKKFILPYYFAINKSNLIGNRVIKIEHFTNETLRHVERRYYTSRDL